MEGGNNEYKKGLWTVEEDRILMDYIRVHGKGKWNRVNKVTGLKRCGKSCRLRWMNYLSPSVKRGDFSEEEDDLIIRLHNLLGNRWSLIAGRVPGRTDNQVKNHWNTNLSKKLGVISKKGKTKTKITASLDSKQVKEINFRRALESNPELQQPVVPNSNSNSNSNSNNIGDEEEAASAAGFDKPKVMVIKDKIGSKSGVGFSGMWEAMMMSSTNYDSSSSSSFWFYNDHDLNLYSSNLLDPSLDDHFPLQFEFVSDGL